MARTSPESATEPFASSPVNAKERAPRKHSFTKEFATQGMSSFSLMMAPSFGSATPSSTPFKVTSFFRNFFSCLLSLDSTKSVAAATASVVSLNGANFFRVSALAAPSSVFSFKASLSGSRPLSLASFFSS